MERPADRAEGKGGTAMNDILRITPEEARRKVLAGEALLVCAYNSDEKFQLLHLEGAIPLSELRQQQATLPRSREIIFYCG